MIIANLIREVNTEEEIYFLLTSYIEAVRYCDKLGFMPAQMSALPLAGKDDLQARFEKLIIELDKASKRLDDKACVVLKEALAVFSTALNCIRTLENKRRRPPAGVDQRAALTWSAVRLAESNSPVVGKIAASKDISPRLLQP